MTKNRDKPKFIKNLLFYGKKALLVGAEMSPLFVHLEKPSPAALVAVGAKLLTVVEHARKINFYDFIKSWKKFDAGPINEYCFELALAQGLLGPLKGVTPSWHGDNLFEGDIHGVRVIWQKQSEYPLKNPWHEDNADISNALGRLIWESVGTKAKLQSRTNNSFQREIVPDDLSSVLPSKKGQDLFKDLQKYLERGRGRTVLLHGEPGTGKSQMMKYVASLAGGTSFRVDARDLANLGLVKIFNLLQPSVILVDDLDRASNSSQILTEIELLREKKVLFLVSVNDPKLLDYAILRAGRFDEYIHIDKLDEEIISAKIKGVDEEAAKILRSMPIAYIDAYCDDVEMLGKERAFERIEEHKKRHELVQMLAQKK